jgi:glycosyltransferase involved in cell wall biosynthesis
VRIGFLTQYYPPESGAPQARLSHLAGELARAGHEVVVLTAMPNYPGGRVFEGYGGLFRRERRDSIQILRCWISPSQSLGRLRRLWTYFSFVFSSALAGLIALPRLDFLLTESPPLFLGLTGWLLSRRTRARWIFNVSDLWPESAVRLGLVGEGPALRASRALEAFCYRKAWLVTAQSRGILEDIRRRFPGVPLHLLSNGVDTDLFRPDRRSADARAQIAGDLGPEGCVALYAGLHGIAQGLDQLIEAARGLRPGTPLKIVLVGDGPERRRLLARAQELGLSDVRFLDPRPREEIPALLASADVALVPLGMDLPGAVPSKLYEAMGSGVPVLLVAGGEPAEIVRRTGAGVAVAPGNPAALRQTLEGLAADPESRRRMGRAGRRAAEEEFDRRAIARRFRERLEGAAAC